MDAIVITFRDGSTRYNLWVWPKPEGPPSVEVSRRDDGEPTWGPPLLVDEVAIQGALNV